MDVVRSGQTFVSELITPILYIVGDVGFQKAGMFQGGLGFDFLDAGNDGFPGSLTSSLRPTPVCLVRGMRRDLPAGSSAVG